MHRPHLINLVLLVSIALAGCAQDDNRKSTDPAADLRTISHEDKLPDTTGASVWQFLTDSDYRSEWTLWPGKGKLYTGQEPHGMLLTTYLNEAALEALSTHSGAMPAGAILVKENYMPDSTLAAVTVMYKVAGYNPDHNDWFFSKFNPDGSLATMPNGMAMEGRLMGCQNCHGGVKPNDYIFTGSLSE